ncbi:MAG TPA: glycoside hydrolase family 3 N-terminal domain-containing protein, partial [Treponemataceae bacterium]|nr:glycoside hydrolase family 3 N-terminal domain-containing protein [Treponemataceae bacterium]
MKASGRVSPAIAAASTLALCALVACAVALFSSANTPRKTGHVPGFWDPVENRELAKSIVDEMTDEEMLAQILMFGWAGADPSPLVTDWVAERGLGSIKVFGWNTDNTLKVAESVSTLQEKAKAGRFHIPLFVATDQEGGWIRHIKGRTTETPGNLAIGASGLPADAWYSGYYIARELRALGINLNFAPTVDLYTDHGSTVIGPRSFGEDPESAGVLGAAFAAGSRAAGVLTTAKHFPGHGDTDSDSHGRLPVINIDERTLMERELVPFKRLVEAGVPAIMSGHLSFPRVTGSGVPATFSRYLLED